MTDRINEAEEAYPYDFSHLELGGPIQFDIHKSAVNELRKAYLAACEKCEGERDAEMVRLIDALRMAIAIIDESEPMNGHPDLDAYMYCKDELHNISEQFKTQSHDK